MFTGSCESGKGRLVRGREARGRVGDPGRDRRLDRGRRRLPDRCRGGRGDRWHSTSCRRRRRALTPFGTGSTSSLRSARGRRSGATWCRATWTASAGCGPLRPRADGARVWIEAPPELLRYCVEKGSITVDGVSLTVAGLDDRGFEVALVPHTLESRPSADSSAGDEVNLEADVLAKYVGRLLPGTLRPDDGSRAAHRKPLRHDRGGDRGDPRGPLRRRRRRRPTARTRAISRSPPSSRRPTRSTSWSRMGEG